MTTNPGMPPIRNTIFQPKIGTSQAPSCPVAASPTGKDQFIQQKESPAPVSPRQFTDVCGRHRHFAADADALHQPAHQQRRKITRHRARKTHDRHDRDRGCRAADSSECFRGPAEQQRSGKLAHVTGPDEQSDLRGRNVPEADQNRQSERQRQRVKCVKKSRAAHDHARLRVPARERHVLETRDQCGCFSFAGPNRSCFISHAQVPRAIKASICDEICSGHSMGVRCRPPGITNRVEP